MKNLCTKIQKTTYGTHIYLICILCGYVIWCHNCPYHILVHIQVGDTATDTEKNLLECVGNARDEKEKAEEESYSVKCKARDLNQWLVPSIEMSHQELENLVHDIEGYKKSMKQAEKQMQAGSSAFMAAHSATMEVLGVAGKVQYQQRFSHKGVRHMRCMFYMMVFNSDEVCKNISPVATRQYLKLLWVFLIHVANVYMAMSLQLHMHVQVYVDSFYMKMYHFLVDVILFFLYYVEEGTSSSQTMCQFASIR